MSEVEVNKPTPAPQPAPPATWDPFAELDAWTRRLGQRPFLSRMPHLLSAFDGVDFTPLADIEETDNGWTVEVELPSVDKKDIEVETRGRTIIISGERKKKERTGVIRKQQRVTGTFRYEVTLSADIDADGITAQLDDGELTVNVPRAEADQPRKITIN